MKSFNRVIIFFLFFCIVSFASAKTLVKGDILYNLKSNATRYQIKKLNRVLRRHGYAPVKSKTSFNLQKRRKNGLFAKLKRAFRRRSYKRNFEINLVKKLMRTGAVEFAEPNFIEYEDYSKDDRKIASFNMKKSNGTENDPQMSEQWYHGVMDTQRAWKITQGKSKVIVAICDSGIEAEHEDLKGSLILPGKNLRNDSTDITPGTNHGTMVAGVIASQPNKVGGIGVAPNVKIYPVKISNDGGASISLIAKCIKHSADYGAKVINVSYTGVNYYSIKKASLYAREKGALVTYAAGNHGRRRKLRRYPDYESHIAVGGSNESEARHTKSNYGHFIDIMAPGRNIFTTVPYISRNTYGKKYTKINGTSFAAPLIAGVAALIYSVNPDFTPEEVEKFLYLGAEKIGSGSDYVYGNGRVNAYFSVKAAQDSLR